MNGLTGRPRKPTALKALAGNPGKHRLPAHEPRPDPTPDQTPPRWMAKDRAAVETWTEIAPECHRLGLLTRLGDRQALAAGCRWWAIYRKADAALRVVLTETSRANGRQPKAELKIAATAFDKAMAVFTRFGVTPAERARLDVAPPAPPQAPRGPTKDPGRFFHGA